MTKRARIRRTVGLTSWVVLLGACSSDSHDVGGGLAYDRSQLSSYAASWDGYAEAYQFESGSDRVRIDLDENGDGTIRFGDVAPLPPPTDPDVGYPPNDPVDPATMGGAAAYGAYEAFVYTVLGARVEDERIRLEVNTGELFDDWCALQTPVLDTSNTDSMTPRYLCVANTGYATDNNGVCYQSPPLLAAGAGGMAGMPGMPGFAGAPDMSMGGVPSDPANGGVPIDCGKLDLCLRSVCECTATSCEAVERIDISLDAALDDDGTSLEGTLLLMGERVTLRLQRE